MEAGLDRARIRVVCGGVDAAAFHPAARRPDRRALGLPEAGHLLLTACRLVPKKGIETLLEAVARLRGVHLAIAGDGRHRERYERAAAGLPVTFLGALPHSRLREYYWAADQFVLASREHVDPRTGLRDVETMGRVLCEANGAGVPVVASRTGGIPSVIEHGENGLLVAEDAPEQLAGAIELLRGDGALRARLRQRGLERARKSFDWSIVFGAHDRALEAAAGAAPVPAAADRSH
jgi:glycosyltransferase involved in cell wall biosynthesis